MAAFASPTVTSTAAEPRRRPPWSPLDLPPVPDVLGQLALVLAGRAHPEVARFILELRARVVALECAGVRAVLEVLDAGLALVEGVELALHLLLLALEGLLLLALALLLEALPAHALVPEAVAGGLLGPAGDLVLESHAVHVPHARENRTPPGREAGWHAPGAPFHAPHRGPRGAFARERGARVPGRG